MKKLVKKDNINRSLLKKVETKRFVFKNLIRNNNFLTELKSKAMFKLRKSSKKSSSIYFVNRCIITGRKNRLNQFYSFSRIVLLKFVRLGYLSGLKKSSW